MKTGFVPWQALLLLLALGSCADAWAFVVSINPGPRAVYLRVGDGVFSGNYNNNGTPGAGGGINIVSVSVPAGAVGNGVAQAMTSNATQATSNWDGYAFCNLPSQVYVGGFFRRPGTTAGNAVLSVSAPANLVDSDGDTIAISQISWTSSGNGDGTATQPVPAGSFTGGAQTLATFPVNTWRESCHGFSYANAQVVASGTYIGRVTYTLSTP